MNKTKTNADATCHCNKNKKYFSKITDCSEPQSYQEEEERRRNRRQSVLEINMILLLALLFLPLDVTATSSGVGARGTGDLASITSITSGKNLSSTALFNASSSSPSSLSFYSSSPSLAQHHASKAKATTFVSMPNPRGGGVLKRKTTTTSPKKQPFSPVLSGEECFLPVSSIAALTLSDVATAFRFAIESNRPTNGGGGGAGKKLLHCEKKDRTLAMMRSMEEAACKSRGEGVLPAATLPLDPDCSIFSTPADHHTFSHIRTKKKKSSSSFDLLSPMGGFGDIDALQFCAAMRIFAEWRLVRQVPDGYRGYAVGMELGHKDVVQNVGKIEEAVHEWIQLRRAAAAEGGDKGSKQEEIRGPTLRQLLHHELELQTHGEKLPKLRDPSAAMGLLWARRQLQYQTSIFSNVMMIPHSFTDARHAVSEAYTEVFEHLHGWAIQKVFQVSFRAAPDAGLIFRHMNPEELERVKHRVKKGEVLDESVTENEGEKEKEETIKNDKEEREKREKEELETKEIETEEKKMAKEQKKIEKEDKKKAKAEKKQKIVPEVTELQSEKKLKLLSLGKHGVVRKIFRRKAKKVDNTSIITHPSSTIRSSLRQRLRVPFTTTIRSHVPSTETIRISRRKRLVQGIRRAFSSSSNSAASVAATPPRLEQSNRFRGGAKRAVQQELKVETTKKTKDKESWREKRRRKKQQKKNLAKSLSRDALEEYVTKQMELDARERIKVYLHVAEPLLDDLEGLFHETNMEDPSTV